MMFTYYKLPQDVHLEDVLASAKSNYELTHVLFVIRAMLIGKKRVTSSKVRNWVATNFKKDIVECLSASAWPGTALFGHRSLVYVLHWSDKLGEKLVSHGPKLSDWQDDNLPEDLCLLAKGQDKPIFLSVTHAKDYWILGNRRPSIPRVNIVGEKVSSFNHIWNGPFFCTTDLINNEKDLSLHRLIL